VDTADKPLPKLRRRGAHRLRALGVEPQGFYTQEVRAGGERVSFVFCRWLERGGGCWSSIRFFRGGGLWGPGLAWPGPASQFSRPAPSSIHIQRGFDVVTMDGRRGPLARVGKATAGGGQPTVRSFFVLPTKPLFVSGTDVFHSIYI
jgi:hypothetical protein